MAGRVDVLRVLYIDMSPCSESSRRDSLVSHCIKSQHILASAATGPWHALNIYNLCAPLVPVSDQDVTQSLASQHDPSRGPQTASVETLFDLSVYGWGQLSRDRARSG